LVDRHLTQPDWTGEGDAPRREEEVMSKTARVKSAERPATLKDVESWLRGQDKEALLNLLLTGMKENERLVRRLFSEVAQAAEGGVNVATYRRAIDDAVEQETSSGTRRSPATPRTSRRWWILWPTF
jgi:hypothetical protein